MIPHIQRSISGYEQELKEIEGKLSVIEDFNDDLGYSYYKHHSKNNTNAIIRAHFRDIIELMKKRDSLVLTIKRLRSFILIKSKTVTEASLELMDQMGGGETIVHQNFEDIAGAAVEESKNGSVDTLDTGQRNLLYMSDFLARPLKVAQSVIPLDDDFTFELDVWDSFLSHPSVRAKLRNYAYLNAALNLRITVSGTPWHFGKLQVSYQPLAGHNRNLEFLEPQLLGAKRLMTLTYLSQAKGATVIDVHDNKPLEVECPFISPMPMIRLFNKSPLVIAAAGPYNDAVGFGKLYINSISPIRAINATATEIGVQVYAWMSNVELGSPTGTVIEIGTEASISRTDERETGPIERITTSVANAASMLANVPIIGRFAKASIAPLTLMSKVASLFGFSYPTLIGTPSRTRIDPFQNTAQCIGTDTGFRLTMDPKQELSVDPRATGVETDDMSYDLICSTESLLDVFEWASSDGQLAGSIWMAPVNPNISKRFLASAGLYYVAPTALGFVSTPHEWWRGDITFRFEIVCSQFHRGTLAVVFEPNISQNVVIDTVLDLNKQYIKKIDLQSVTDFEITVKWAYPKPWAKVLTSDLFGDLGTVGFLGDALFDYANGYIAVVPYTELQSPDGSPITINVYIRSDNMHLNQFTMEHVPTARPITEGSIEVHTPNIIDKSDLNDSSATETNITVVNYGEMPTSFRLMLKRFMAVYDPDSLKVTTSATRAFGVLCRAPIWPWPQPSYETHASSKSTLMGYLRYAYLGMRGGTKVKANVFAFGSIQQTTPTMVSMNLPSLPVTDPVVVYEGDRYGMVTKPQGTMIYMPSVNSGIEFEVPMYTPDLFLISFKENPLESSSIVESNISTGYTIEMFQHVEPGYLDANHDFAVSLNTAAAEDFSFMRYSGAPIYSYTS